MTAAVIEKKKKRKNFLSNYDKCFALETYVKSIDHASSFVRDHGWPRSRVSILSLVRLIVGILSSCYVSQPLFIHRCLSGTVVGFYNLSHAIEFNLHPISNVLFVISTVYLLVTCLPPCHLFVPKVRKPGGCAVPFLK